MRDAGNRSEILIRLPSLLLLALSALGWSAEPIEKYQALVKSGATVTIPAGEYEGTLNIPNGTHDLTVHGEKVVLHGRIIEGGAKNYLAPWVSGPAMLWNGRIVTHVNGIDTQRVNVRWLPYFDPALIRDVFPWTGTPVAYAANLTRNITLTGFKLVGDRSMQTGVYLAQVQNPKIIGFEITGFQAHGIFLVQCSDYEISGCAVWNMGTPNVAGGGYGIGAQDSSYGLIQNCKGRDIRYVVTLSGDYRTIIRGISGDGISAAVVDLHGLQSWQVSISKVTAANSYSAVKIANESWGPEFLTFIDTPTITGRINIVPVQNLPAWARQ